MKTHVLVIGDRSGSMDTILLDAVGGYNHFIKEQKSSGADVLVTLVLFDDKYEVCYRGMHVNYIGEMTKEIWMARGSTALLYAIGRGITEFSEIPKDKNDQVVVVIITDGQENTPKDGYTAEKVKEIIKGKEFSGWKFIFLASNLDAISDAQSWGINANATYSYKPENIMGTYRAMSGTISGFACTGNFNTDALKVSPHVLSGDY